MRKILEEIVIQQIANLEQQVGVYPFAAENLVHVLTRIVQLLGHPCDGASLLFGFGLDELAYMYFFFHNNLSQSPTKKSVKPFLYPTEVKGICKAPQSS